MSAPTTVVVDPLVAPSRRTLAGLAVVSGAAALVVAGLADAALEHDGASRLDPVVAGDVLHLRSPALTVLAHAASVAGSEVVVGVVAVVVLVVLLVRHELQRAAVLAIGMGGSAVLTVAVKLLVGRPRPGPVDRLGPVDATYSFPSGHTLNSVVLLALLVWLLSSRAPARRLPLAVVAALAGLAVAASRVYLGYHWTTDVVASGLVALSWLCVVAMVAAPVGRVVERAERSLLHGRR